MSPPNEIHHPNEDNFDWIFVGQKTLTLDEIFSKIAGADASDQLQSSFSALGLHDNANTSQICNVLCDVVPGQPAPSIKSGYRPIAFTNRGYKQSLPNINNGYRQTAPIINSGYGQFISKGNSSVGSSPVNRGSPFGAVGENWHGGSAQLGGSSSAVSPGRSGSSPDCVDEVPENYICHICLRPGHHIKNCIFARPKSQSLTPYQGTKRCFGEFKCLRCNRKWMSGNSWANKSQQCKKCCMPVYPHKQKAPELGLNGFPCDREESKAHREDLCEKCRLDGVYCGLRINRSHL